MAAPVIEGYAEAQSATTTSTATIDKPTGTASGDILVAFIGLPDKGALPLSGPAGWTKEVEIIPTFSSNEGLSVWYKVAGGSEPANYSWTLTAARRFVGAIFRVSGYNTSSPINASGGFVNNTGEAGSSASAPVAPSVTTSVADCLLLCAASSDTGDETFTAPSGMALEWQLNQSNTGLSRVSTAVASETVTSGATGTRTFGISVDSFWSAASIAIAPAAGGGGGTDALTADDVEASSEVTSPAIGQTHGLSANDVESASSLSVPAVGQVHGLSAGGVESASEISTPALGIVHNLLADDVEASSSVGTPTVGQVHALAANDIQSATTVTSPSVGQAHILLANDVASTSEVSAPALAEVTDGVDALLAGDIEAASRVGSPTLGQVHTLTAESIESAAVVSMPTLDRDSGFRQPGGFYPGRNIIYLDKDGNPVDLEEYRRRTANQAIQGAKKAANEAPARNRQEAKRVARSLESAIRANMADAIAAHVRDLQELANVAERARLALAEIERLAEEDDEAAVLMLMAS